MPKYSEPQNSDFLKRYYRLHSKIYDLTRWSFLFGRKAIIHQLPASVTPARILEVGCGTGKNLRSLCQRFPQTRITGVDLSDAMLAVARKNLKEFEQQLTLELRSYNQPLQPKQPFDLILFSYSLSMFNPGWAEAIEYAYQDLADGGLIAVVDFHDSAFPGFKWWMGLNHVRMDGHLLAKLQTCFQPRTSTIRKAYAGIWSYLLFLGEK